ncbi:autotransporter outer membrane beta-barrel domain-containing protein [Rodentibacter myodis]|uniref:Autotransporter domain-containing protein n=1 Tax=Rodentibacter myodis TaxID=1907939 RepID=A0A1V3JID3_9PAST|nr:autotransporter outer membrane beta-barrel domain-containing protein [Rodentibacter myodis]OOF56435.1 hypothetical protein BKL49_10645 [Rodentibacter myodis]
MAEEGVMSFEPEQSISQAQGISRYANAALSDFNAQTHQLLQMSRRLDQHLLDHRQSNGNVWVHTESQKNKNSSKNYRTFEQNTHLTQIGVETSSEQNIQLGGILSQSVAHNDYDQGNGRSRLIVATGYVKAYHQNGLWGSLDMNIGRAKNQIKLDDEKNNFQRDFYALGANVGVQRQILGIDLQSAIGLRYYHISAVNYDLNQAEVAVKTARPFNYHLGLKLSKTFEFKDFSLTPSLAGYYVNHLSKNGTINRVKVNNHRLNQPFGYSLGYQLGLAARYKRWELSGNWESIFTKETGKQTALMLEIRYYW